MTKEEIIHRLRVDHKNFTTYISLLNDQDFVLSLPGEKWTAGQQLDHIYRSVFPLKLVLGLPKWVTKLIFSKANRSSKKYDELVNKYIKKLENGGTASGRFIPGQIKLTEKITIVNKMEKAVAHLCQSLQKFTEQEMDRLVLPHPLLGKLTLREMMYFTIYHVEHHHQNTIRNFERI